MSSLPDRRTLSKYEIVSVIGQGGMGVVYKARDPLIDRTVAIKTIRSDAYENDQELLARLRMEAKTAGRLQHPNIVTIYDFGQEADLTYLVMEYVEGANLQRVISSGMPIPLMQRLEIVIQLADAISYAHGLGVTHRDIKPANICLTRRGDPKILDFGLARIGETRLTRTGFTSGTAMYMSPERMSGENGPSDDVFALGAVAYEIFTGAPAFPGTTISEVARNIMSGNYPVPPSTVADLPKELDEIIARATASRKQQRYQSASELATALRDLQHSSTFRRRAGSLLDPKPFVMDDENPYTAADAAVATATLAQLDTMVNEARDAYAETSIDAAPVIPTAPAIQMARPETESVPTEPIAYTPRHPALPPDESAEPATELLHEPGSGFFDAPRTVVARIVRRMRGDAQEQPVPPADTDAAPVSHLREFAIAAIALLALVAALPVTARAGGGTSSTWILVYAAAAGAWWFMVRAAAPTSLKQVFLIGALIHLAVAVQQPLTAIAQSWDGPVAALLTKALVASGEVLVFRRALVLAAVALGTWLLWKTGKPRRALGFATFPLIVLEGTLNARIEIIAAVLLFAATILIRRNREGWSGLATFLSIGLFVPAVVLLPPIWDEAYHVAPFIGAALLVLIATKLMLPDGSGWTGSITNWVSSSPSLSAATAWLAMQLTMWNVATFLNDVSTRAQQRSGTSWSWKFDEQPIAILIVFALVITVSSIAARRAKVPEASSADAIGTTMLLSVALWPAAWMLVVPFAIAANRRIWILIALCAPVLSLAHGGAPNWIVYGASLLIPGAWWLALRLGERTGDGAEPGSISALAG